MDSDKKMAKKGEGLIGLPSALNKENSGSRMIFNIYKSFGKKREYYYHTTPFDRRDHLIEEDINVQHAMEKVQKYNLNGHK